MVGFMRRFDPGYRDVKAARLDGRIGAPLMLHNIHRNPVVPDSFTSFMTITDAIIHEFDVTRWMLDEEIASIQVIPPARSPRAAEHLQDPQFAAMTTTSGVLSTVSFFANCTYGYDVRCELTGSEGVASLVNPATSSTFLGGADAGPIPASWKVRFGATYHAELQEWISGLLRGETVGPSAWDGYAATRVAEAGVEAVRTGERVAIDYIAKPDLYA
jgi:myo-inositol 2-dehydrogenase/D-chiro-inositol 1-dehydrogenase